MNRDEFLAIGVMGWHWEVRKLAPDSGVYLEGWITSDGLWNEAKWDPGEDWSQTGLLLDAMKQDYQVEIVQQVGFLNPREYHVVFTDIDQMSIMGTATDADLREAIATAAALAKGWVK